MEFRLSQHQVLAALASVGPVPLLLALGLPALVIAVVLLGSRGKKHRL